MQYLIDHLQAKGIQSIVDGDALLIGDDLHPASEDELFALRKEITIKSVKDFSANARKIFTRNSPPEQLATYQINSDIINLINCWCMINGASIDNITKAEFDQAFPSLEKSFREKMTGEVAQDPRYANEFELFQTWVVKRALLSNAAIWAESIEHNTIAMIENETNPDNFQAILDNAKTKAEAKISELIR